MHKWYETIVVILVTVLLQSQQFAVQQTEGLLTQCGEKVSPPSINLWMRVQDGIEMQRIGESTVRKLAIYDLLTSPNGLYQSIKLDGGQGVATLSNIGSTGEKVITVFTPGGNSHSISSTDTDYSWWRLSPEYSTGHFHVIGYDKERQLTLLEVNWSENGLAFGAYHVLPIRFNPRDFFTDLLYVSPGSEYIGYVQRDSSTGHFVYIIFSVREERIIWQTPYDGDHLTDIFWYADDPERVAIISGSTAESISELRTVYRSGYSEMFVDLSVFFGPDTQISGGLEAVVSGAVTPFWVMSPELFGNGGGARLIAIDSSSEMLKDLCFTGTSGPLIRTPDGSYVLFQHWGTVQDEIVGVDLATGDRFTLGQVEGDLLFAAGPYLP